MQTHSQLILPATLNLSHMARQASKEAFKWMGFSEREVQQWELIVDELFMNAVKYGSAEEGAMVYLNYHKTEDGAIFEIEDEGNGPKPTTPDGLRQIIKNNQEHGTLEQTSGRGLALIIAKWTDHYDIEKSPKGGLLIRVEKKHHDESSVEKVEPETSAVISPHKVLMVVSANVGRVFIDDYVKPIQVAIDALQPRQSMELNFSQVPYINSIFIGHLADWYNQVQQKGAFLILSDLNPALKEILTVVGLDKIFNFNR